MNKSSPQGREAGKEPGQAKLGSGSRKVMIVKLAWTMHRGPIIKRKDPLSNVHGGYFCEVQ